MKRKWTPFVGQPVPQPDRSYICLLCNQTFKGSDKVSSCPNSATGHHSKIQQTEDIQCPVCGYYCLGKGGLGCIDKPRLVTQ